LRTAFTALIPGCLVIKLLAGNLSNKKRGNYLSEKIDYLS